jgi:hypothetical protein
MNHWRSANEADFSLNILFSPAILPFLSLLPRYVALSFFGIFGQATTKAASTAKTRRWWYGGCC